MHTFDYDLIAIGSGPAGESAALNAAKHDLRAAVIEIDPRVGGSCTHRGTIPSKVLRHAVRQLLRYNASPLYQVRAQQQISFPQLLSSAGTVINKQVTMRTKYYQRNRIDVIHGHARFQDANTVEVAL